MVVSQLCIAQQAEKLTVEKIMRDPLWMGSSPSAPYWSSDGRYLFFSWNPENKSTDSVYYITKDSLQPRKSGFYLRQQTIAADMVVYNLSRTAYVYSREGDVYWRSVKSPTEKRITETAEIESNPSFMMGGTKIVYSRNQNLFAWDIASGSTTQLTNFQRGVAPPNEQKPATLTAQQAWLKSDQVKNMDVIRWRKEKRDSAEQARKAFPKATPLRTIYFEDKVVRNVTVSPDGKYIAYQLSRPNTTGKSTIVPNYVTESGFTEDIAGRTKVGVPFGVSESFVFDKEKDTVIALKTAQLPGITDVTDFSKDYPRKDTAQKKENNRAVNFFGPFWNNSGSGAVFEIYSADNKDRWLMLLNPASGSLKLLDRQRDEAWVGGPGIGPFNSSSNRWMNDSTYWYQSEATGYSHLYTVNVRSGVKTALTSGKFEVQQVELSFNKKNFYITTNEAHPGEKHFYRLSVNGGKMERITATTGAHQVVVSPDEKQLAILYSYSNKPWELYLQENKARAKLYQVTDKAQSPEFRSYKWIDPEVITFPASDGAKVYARLFKSVSPHSAKPAVIFVHGAGYLQNAHKWWSSYFREYMFHNMLVENGYTVLDIDYRGSAGYGRDWRTGIYRFMGGKDLDDHIDGAKYLVEKLEIDAKRIGIYGGSYGGFITLMAMFTKPGVFAAGAGLRSVTDWAHYNHGYTSNILNEPFTDSIAYRKSSPIYHAQGLKGALLMCHGMVDQNVHFQDIVRLSQRLIELKKDNWELAVYPMEDHAFVEPSSWTDEYKRIFKLFETNLKR
ncbi:MAG: prolyl oligopeptidase family serine peptidase [Chitinophagaceae bacterium]